MTIHDPVESAALALLRELATERMPHGHGRTLFTHLTGVARVVTAWGAPLHVRRAALFHSVYGTSVYRAVAADVRRRTLVRDTIGAAAESLVFAFGAMDRPRFSAALAEMPDAPRACVVTTRYGAHAYEPAEVVALAVIGAANEFEQTCAADGSPAPWRVWCRPLVDALERWRPADLSASILDGFAATDRAEDDDASAYGAAIAALGRGDMRVAVAAFEALAASSTGSAEPYAWLADIAAHSGDRERAAEAASRARARFLAWGGAWDKRLSLDEWLAVIESIEATGRAPSDAEPLLARVATREG